MILWKKRNSVKLIINSTETEESKKVLLLGITIDNLLTFNEHIDNLCRTANYAPLVWMFCRKKEYLKIQKIHHQALKMVYNSNKNYDELLHDNNEF